MPPHTGHAFQSKNKRLTLPLPSHCQHSLQPIRGSPAVWTTNPGGGRDIFVIRMLRGGCVHAAWIGESENAGGADHGVGGHTYGSPEKGLAYLFQQHIKMHISRIHILLDTLIQATVSPENVTSHPTLPTACICSIVHFVGRRFSDLRRVMRGGVQASRVPRVSTDKSSGQQQAQKEARDTPPAYALSCSTHVFDVMQQPDRAYQLTHLSGLVSRLLSPRQAQPQWPTEDEANPSELMFEEDAAGRMGCHLGVFSCTVLIIGRTIGTGIFSMPSSILFSIGTTLMLWVLGSVLSFCGLFAWLVDGSSVLGL
ncbi:hypothetical protein BDZ97DRAFT_1923639 [Flammula alnicola]|nr:hypothetical protein BDZ97DRAFT_1923639 [Flammula alnicola]